MLTPIWDILGTSESIIHGQKNYYTFRKMVFIFCPEMALAQFPEMGFFVQKSRIVVKQL